MEKNIKEKIKEIISRYLRTSDKDINFKILTEIAQLRKGKIKEGEVYVNATTKMTFIDKLGNEFKTTPNAIKSSKWSPYESGRVLEPEFHMKEIKEIVSFKNGKIKDGETYINNSTKMIFIDQWGNEFGMTPGNLKTGRWSPYESGNVYNNPEYHMEELQKIALSKKGRIKKGEKYINANTKMTFIDQLGNEFSMTPTSVKSGRWSHYESGKVRDSNHHIEELQKIAISKGGKIKDGERYIKSTIKMVFIDKLGNEFTITPGAVKSGQWSPYESGNVYNNPSYHMQEIQKIALLEGYKIKDGEIYVNAKTKMTFIDKLGNEFRMNPNNFKTGRRPRIS